MKIEKQTRKIIIKMVASILKECAQYVLPQDVLPQDVIDYATDCLIDKLSDKMSVNDILEDSILEKLNISENFYDFVRENVKIMLDECKFNNSMFEQYGYDISNMAMEIVKPYVKKNAYSDAERALILKGMQSYLEIVALLSFEKPDFILKFAERVYETQEEQQKLLDAVKQGVYRIGETQEEQQKSLDAVKQDVEILKCMFKSLFLNLESLTDTWPNLSVWWLLNGRKANKYGCINDRYSIKLFTLLLGMTDPYNIIIASGQSKGLCAGLCQTLNDYSNKDQVDSDNNKDGLWIEFDDRIPDILHSFPSEVKGIVLNICADYSCLERLVLNATEKKKKDNLDLPIVINIWSKNQFTALSAVKQLQRSHSYCVSIEFLSAVSYSVFANESTNDELQLSFNDKKSLKECEKKLTTLFNNNPSKWWGTIEQLAYSDDLNDNFLGFLAAKPLHNAVQMWLDRIRSDSISEIIKSDLFAQTLSSEDKNFLYFAVSHKLKTCDPQNKERWEEVLIGLQGFCSESVEIFLSLDDNCDVEQNDLALDDFTIANWARYASQETFEGMLPYLRKESLTFFWVALVNSEYGINHILNMRNDEKKRSVLSSIINQTEENPNNDYCLNMDTVTARDVIRSYIKED